jgi:hypothetical protein
MHRYKNIFAPLLLAASLSYANLARAEPDTSSGLYIMKGCELLAGGNAGKIWGHLDEDTKRQFLMCGGALVATAQLMQLHHEVCLPNKNIDNQKSAQIVSKYMRSHPDKVHEGFAFVIFRALQEAWPCPK